MITMNELFELFTFQFFTNAILAAFLASITCGIAGTYIVSRRIVFISGGITHSSFGGIGIGYYLGINPVFGAAIFSIFSAIGIEFFTKKGNIRNDSVIAMLWSLGMAIGVIFIYLTPGYAPNLMTYLFGSILTVNFTDMFMLGILALILSLFFTLFYHKILYVAFDEQFDITKNINIPFINYSLMILISLTIVLNIKIVGIILILSLLTIPQNTANLFTRKFSLIIVYSMIIAFTGAMAGLIISYFLNIPSGATIIFCLVIIYLIVRVFMGLKRIKARNKTKRGLLKSV